ncbi:MAG: hypothetical protein K2X87_33850 [Gemmataceae bacterium]|nr:hypothetical protein [Gemmataceae bacterium]
MPPPNLTVNNNSAAIDVAAASMVVTYTCTVDRTTQPAGRVYNATVTTTINDPVHMDSTFPAGRYHLHISGSDGSVFDADFTIPTSPARTKPLTPGATTVI